MLERLAGELDPCHPFFGPSPSGPPSPGATRSHYIDGNVAAGHSQEHRTIDGRRLGLPNNVQCVVSVFARIMSGYEKVMVGLASSLILLQFRVGCL